MLSTRLEPCIYKDGRGEGGETARILERGMHHTDYSGSPPRLAVGASCPAVTSVIGPTVPTRAELSSSGEGQTPPAAHTRSARRCNSGPRHHLTLNLHLKDARIATLPYKEGGRGRVVVVEVGGSTKRDQGCSAATANTANKASRGGGGQASSPQLTPPRPPAGRSDRLENGGIV